MATLKEWDVETEFIDWQVQSQFSSNNIIECLKQADLILKELKQKVKSSTFLVIQSEVPSDKLKLSGLKSAAEFPIISYPVDHGLEPFPSL